jgi:hypothetical protein
MSWLYKQLIYHIFIGNLHQSFFLGATHHFVNERLAAFGVLQPGRQRGRQDGD